MVGALLAEMNETWQERLYFDMDEYLEWKLPERTNEHQAKSKKVA